ncbi:MAG TPA: GNAT family N-acetyltransferase [Candidatus Limnocylindrales bacterium]|nr:GNAT family N-acetyltransferase [Candidatus Limnocylindrales bacterium]
MGEIHIRELKTIDEMTPLVELQKTIWGYTDPYTARLLLVVSKTGGQVLGAYVDEKLVGFAFMFYAYRNGENYLHSQMVGVLPEYRNANVGYALKLAQRDYALRLGLNRIEWTFDPLQSKNAYFNVHKLGAIIRRYEPNYYGNLGGVFNDNLDSDRVYAEWYINSDRVKIRLKGENELQVPTDIRVIESKTVNQVVFNSQGLVQNQSYTLRPPDVNFFVEIPEDFELIKQDLDLAREWRRQLREMLMHFLGEGYSIVEVVSLRVDNKRRNFYYLTHEN